MLFNNEKSNRILYDCVGVSRALRNSKDNVAWRYNANVRRLNQLLKYHPDVTLETIEQEGNSITDEKANYGRRNPQLSMYSKGLDRPR